MVVHWPSGIPLSHQNERSPAPKQNFFRSIWLWDSPILMKRKTHWPCPTESKASQTLSATKRPKTLKLGCYLTSICINGITFLGVSFVWLLLLMLLGAFLPNNFTFPRQMSWNVIVGEGNFIAANQAITNYSKELLF